MRCAFKQHLNKHQIHYRVINAVLMTFVEKKSINLNSKSGCPNLHTLQINKQYFQMITTASEELNNFSFPIFFDKNKGHYDNNILTCSCWASLENGLLWGYCKSIESAIQWFQIHHRMTFPTIPIQLYTFWVQGLTYLYLGSPTIVVFIVNCSMCLFSCDLVHIQGCEIFETIQNY